MLIHITDMNNRNRRGQLSFVVSCHSTHRLQHVLPCKALAEHVHVHRHNYDTEHISVLTQCLFATAAKELLEMRGLISPLWGLTFVTSTCTLEHRLSMFTGDTFVPAVPGTVIFCICTLAWTSCLAYDCVFWAPLPALFFFFFLKKVDISACALYYRQFSWLGHIHYLSFCLIPLSIFIVLSLWIWPTICWSSIYCSVSLSSHLKASTICSISSLELMTLTIKPQSYKAEQLVKFWGTSTKVTTETSMLLSSSLSALVLFFYWQNKKHLSGLDCITLDRSCCFDVYAPTVSFYHYS